jgi:iron complex transport system ATP-binding protein
VGIVRLDVRDLSWAVGKARVLVDAAVSCPNGTLVGLVGPNGSGKSSLLRCIYRVIKPDSGNVTIDGREVWDLTPRALARDLAVVLQERPNETAFTVREIVLMARGPHKKLLERDTADDHQLVASALRRVGIEGLSERVFDTLSGGEKQRVVIARALAQGSRALVLDEPTTHLDVGHQHQVLGLIRELGLTTIAALHDLNLAAAYCDQLFVLDRGSVRAQGTPSEVLTAELVEEIYGVRAAVGRHPLTGRLHVFVDGRGSVETKRPC